MSAAKQKSVYAELCEMFGKEAVDYSIAAAQGKAPCTCGMKNADKCQAKKHTKKEKAGAARAERAGVDKLSSPR